MSVTPETIRYALALDHRAETLALSPVALNSLGATLVRRLKAGETLFAEGDNGRYCYQILSGVLKEYATLEGGEHEISDFYSDGDLIGLADDGGQMQSGEAVTDCSVRCIPRETLFRQARSSAEISSYLLDLMMKRLGRARKRSAQIARKSAAERVAAFLLEIAEHQGGAEDLVIPMSRQDIGDHLGLTIETVCRTLTEFKRQGLIAMRSARRFSIKSLAALERASNGAERIRLI